MKIIKCAGEGCTELLDKFNPQSGTNLSGAYTVATEEFVPGVPIHEHLSGLASSPFGIGVFVVLGVLALLAVMGVIAMLFRVVVSTNEVHIVQSGKRTVSYGKDQAAGNTYYKWPSWIPIIGVKTSVLPMSVFNVNLDEYAAYDKGRVPFNIDVMAFFRINDSNMAAQRVHRFEELIEQLKGILQGAIRSILAKVDIEEILEKRSEFGEEFTAEVAPQLLEWGVVNVKNIELMDIRDGESSQVIANIMAKKKSLIEKESRIEVAKNIQAAKEAEIEAKRQVDLTQQQAEQVVGERTAVKDKMVGIAKEKSQQEINDEAKVTMTKFKAVQEVDKVRTAEIAKAVIVVTAKQEQEQTVIVAEGEKQKTVLIAQGDLEKAKLIAQGIQVQGVAQGEADKAVLLAPVVAQITLAEKISAIPTYQDYLVKIRVVEKDEKVGIEQAQALQRAGIKVIANAGDVNAGVGSVMELFTSKGGTAVGAAVEAFAQTESGQAILKKLVG